MHLRCQMSDLLIKVLQKKTEGYLSSDLKRKSVLTLNSEINSEGDQSFRQENSNSEVPSSDSIASCSDLPRQRKIQLQIQNLTNAKPETRNSSIKIQLF